VAPPLAPGDHPEIIWRSSGDHPEVLRRSPCQCPPPPSSLTPRDARLSSGGHPARAARQHAASSARRSLSCPTSQPLCRLLCGSAHVGRPLRGGCRRFRLRLWFAPRACTAGAWPEGHRLATATTALRIPTTRPFPSDYVEALRTFVLWARASPSQTFAE